MKSHRDDAEAADLPGSLGERAYSSRLLGRDPSLVMHGGNISVKLRQWDLWQAEEDLLYVKVTARDCGKRRRPAEPPDPPFSRAGRRASAPAAPRRPR
jgi:rhamnose utilization protein RhaD (predicted bifunctional aldolase and dehydrogenase)